MIRIEKGDITDMEIEAFVYYASPDLQLGTGFGNAISMRGGPSVQDELKKLGECAVGNAVVTSAGNLKSKFIVHAVGPRFQEEDTEGKLRAVTQSALKAAEEKGIERIAFPPMGAGFYGIPLDVSARVTLGAIKEHLSGPTKIKEVVICMRDAREIKPYQTVLESL